MAHAWLGNSMVTEGLGCIGVSFQHFQHNMLESCVPTIICVANKHISVVLRWCNVEGTGGVSAVYVNQPWKRLILIDISSLITQLQTIVLAIPS